MSGNKQQEDRFFNAETEIEAIEKAEVSWQNLYRPKTQSKDVRSDPDVHPSLWLRATSSRSAQIGVRGLIFALQILSRFRSDEGFQLTSFDFPREIENGDKALRISLLNAFNEEFEKFEDVDEKYVKSTILPKLEDFLRPSRKTLPKLTPDQYELIFVLFGALTQARLSGGRLSKPDAARMMKDARQLYYRLQEAAPQSLNDAYLMIKQAFIREEWVYTSPKPRQSGPDRNRGKHVIPQRFLEYLQPIGRYKDEENPAEYRKPARDIWLDLKGLSRDRAVLLHGDVNAGKSGIIVEILRHIEEECSEHNTIGLLVIDRRLKKPLPVFVLNVSHYSYREVGARILAFLRYQKTTHRHQNFESHLDQIEKEFSKSDIRSLAEIREHIRRAHQEIPCFFIFTNWDEQGGASLRSMLRDRPKSALVNMLLESNADSRVLISTIGRLPKKPLVRFMSQFAPLRLRDIKNPTFDRLIRYFDDLRYPTDHEKFLTTIEQRLRKTKLPGAHLILIAVCLQLIDLLPDRDRRDHELSVYETLEAYVDAASEERGAEGETGELGLLNLLLHLLEKLGALPAVFAVSASDDGLRPGSLQQLIEEERLQGAEVALLPRLRTLARGFFIQEKIPNHLNEGQFAPYESDLAQQPQWELNQTLRCMLVEAILGSRSTHTGQTSGSLSVRTHDYQEDMRYAHQSVAIVARRRACNWRAFAPLSNMSHTWADLLPDIQAYEGLLTSLDPANLQDRKLCENSRSNSPLLRYLERSVFGETTDFSDTVAFRFSVLCLLYDEIDRDRRMAMIYDQDEIRVRLYLLPFIAIGRKEFRLARDLTVEDLPNMIPRHIRNCFDDGEIMMLLESISLAAFHSQCPTIVQWARIRSEELLQSVKGQSRRTLFLRACRLICTSIDMSIQHGYPLRETDGSHRDTLERVRKILREEFPEQESLVYEKTKSANKVLIERDQETIAWLRIKAREAELIGLIGDIESAISLYDHIRKIEEIIGRTSSGRSPFDSPKILSGRPARSLLRTILRSTVFDAGGRIGALFEARDAWVRQILDINTARLNRFGGAEQIALLVDKCQYAYKRGKFAEATDLARLARNAIDRGNISFGMRLQVIRTYVAVELAFLEQKIEDNGGLQASDWRRAKRVALDSDLLERVAGALEFGPTFATAGYLRVRTHKLMEREPNKSGAFVVGIDSKATMARSIRKMNHHHDHSFQLEMQKLARECGVEFD